MGEIRYTNQEGVARLILCNPSARNAMSVDMMMQFFKYCSSDRRRKPQNLVLLTGDGTKSFCSGGDLRDVRSSLIEKGREMSEMMNDLTNRIQKHIAMFVIVGVEGAAIGGGAELLTLGDWVIANQNARIQFVQALSWS